MGFGGYHGLYVADTRHLSRFVLRLGGRLLERLGSDLADHGRATFHLANPAIGRLSPRSLTIVRDRQIRDGLTERIEIVSYEMAPLRLRLSLELAADFLDIFEVLGRPPLPRAVAEEQAERGMRFIYRRGGRRRATTVNVSRPFRFESGRLGFDLALEHGQVWELEVRIEAEEGPRAPSARRGPAGSGRAIAARIGRRRPVDPERIDRWAARVPRLESDDPRLVSAWQAAVRDMRALLLAERGGAFIPAAGVPWFMAVFGRDASITALQSLITGGEIARGTLHELAVFQGRRTDPFRDEEPGKIPHEVRRGELAVLDRVPHARYYGSADATPLYVRLFAEACRWTGWLDGGAPHGPMPPALRRVLPAAERAVAWIDDRVADGDGLIWYRRRRRTGIRNQAWKDSEDSYRFAGGRLARTPIAAVEVQGYAVAAWRGMADVLDALGRRPEATGRRAAADAMVARIDERFWMPDAGSYAMGLDRYGHQVDAVTSNPGHLLWSGAVSPARAAAVAERLMAPDMFSGWGIRTMSSRMAAYNPISYHNGSVWPHDNSIIAAGLARYGAVADAWRIADALLEAASRDPAVRLPELFAGFERGATSALVGYPVACAPQAWASGAIFQLVQVLLGLEPSRDGPRLAAIPDAPALTLAGLRMGSWQGEVNSSQSK